VRIGRTFPPFVSVCCGALPFDNLFILCYKRNMLTDKQLIRQGNPDNASRPLQQTFAPVNTENLNHLIAQRLTKAIEEEAIKPGEKLPSVKELMALFKVGRSSVREALHSLVGLKLVEVHPGKGYYVRQPSGVLHGEALIQFTLSEQDFLDIMEAREEIEPRIARMAAQRVLPEDLEKLEQAYSEIQQAVAQGEDRYTGKIHLGIARASHNSVFERIMEGLLPLFPGRVRGRTIPVAEEVQMHRKLIDGLRTGDADLMEHLMVEHLHITRKFYLNTVGKGGGLPGKEDKAKV